MKFDEETTVPVTVVMRVIHDIRDTINHLFDEGCESRIVTNKCLRAIEDDIAMYLIGKEQPDDLEMCLDYYAGVWDVIKELRDMVEE